MTSHSRDESPTEEYRCPYWVFDKEMFTENNGYTTCEHHPPFQTLSEVRDHVIAFHPRYVTKDGPGRCCLRCGQYFSTIKAAREHVVVAANKACTALTPSQRVNKEAEQPEYGYWGDIPDDITSYSALQILLFPEREQKSLAGEMKELHKQR